MKERMRDEIIGYSVKLQPWFRRDGRQWLVWCPAIDVMTQASTKKRALESLREAVELWFESCIDRGVLDAALKELGFTEVPPHQDPGVDFVGVIKRLVSQPKQARPIQQQGVSFSLDHGKGYDYIEGIIPAYIAAQQLGNAARARC